MVRQVFISAILAIAFFGSIYRIAMEMESMSLIENSGYLLLLGFVPMILTIPALIRYVKRSFEGYEVVQYVGISILFISIISQALVLSLNRFGPQRCMDKAVTIQKIEPRYVSAYGKTDSKVMANRWKVTMTLENGSTKIITLKSIEEANEFTSSSHRITWCKSIFGFEKYMGVRS